MVKGCALPPSSHIDNNYTQPKISICLTVIDGYFLAM